jgi:hypothetical protein
MLVQSKVINPDVIQDFYVPHVSQIFATTKENRHCHGGVVECGLAAFAGVFHNLLGPALQLPAFSMNQSKRSTGHVSRPVFTDPIPCDSRAK